MQECVTKQRQTETEEQGAKRKKNDCDRKTKQQQTETKEQCDKHKKTKRDCMRKNAKRWDINCRMIGEIVTGRTWQLLSIVQQRKQNNIYTGHRIQQTPICIEQLFVLYVIVSNYWHGNHSQTYQGRHWCTQWKTWHQKLQRVLPNRTKRRG
jgi:hypothetical protein